MDILVAGVDALLVRRYAYNKDNRRRVVGEIRVWGKIKIKIY